MSAPSRASCLAGIVVAALLLSACANQVNPERNFAPPAASEPAPELTDPQDIARALRAGGYIIYMRHGLTNRAELELEAKNRETGRFSIEDCATQRNLSPEGRAQSRDAGEHFKRLKLPVARFHSSRYCRVLDTAAAFTDRAAWSEALTSEGTLSKNPERIAGVQKLLSTVPPPRENLMLFAHQGIFWEATKLTVQEGWAVVLLPGVWNRVIARIAPGDWARMQ